MKKLRRWGIGFVAMLFVMLLAPQMMTVVSAAEDDIASGISNNITWVIDANGRLTVSGSGDFNRKPEMPTPWYYYKNHIKSAVINVSGMTDGLKWE